MIFRKPLIRIICVALCFSASGLNAQSGISFERNYKIGERYRYELTTEYYQNSQWKSRTVSVCELTVHADSFGIPFESLQWISQQQFSSGDTIDETPVAARVKPYNISLHPKGSLKLPSISEPGMTGPITDFNTFYVAIHDKAGMRKLQKTGDIYESAEPVKGNFGNGRTILKGEDCISLSSKLLEHKAGRVIIRTDFYPPKKPCLDYYLPEFSKPVSGDTLNNIQMIMAANANKVNLQFGKERFDIISSIDTATGMLQEATMTNELVLRLKVNCGADFQNCQAELPWKIDRKIRLRLLP